MKCSFFSEDSLVLSELIKVVLFASFSFASAEILIALAHQAIVPWFTLIILFAFEFTLSFIITFIFLIIAKYFSQFLRQNFKLPNYLIPFQLALILLAMPFFFSFYLLNTKALARLPHTGISRLFFNGLLLFLFLNIIFLTIIFFKKYSLKIKGLNFWSGCFLIQLALPMSHFLFFSSVSQPNSGMERLTFLFALSIPILPIIWLTSYLNKAIKNITFSKSFFIFLIVFFISIIIFVPPFFNFEKEPLSPAADESLIKLIKPNIIFVVWDTGRKDRYSVYGHKRLTTPRLNELAADGYVFQRAYTVAPWTLPSHASMFTGLYPSQHHAEHFDGGSNLARPLSAKALTLAEILSKHGYYTVAWTANHGVLNTWFGLDQGFNFYFDERPHLFDLLSVHLLSRLPQHYFDKLFINTSYLSSEINRYLLPWMRKKLRSPFFLFINYMDPHVVNYLPSPFRGLFEGKQKISRELMKAIMNGTKEIEPPFYEDLLTRYDEELAFCDANFGQFIDELKHLDLYDRSLIVVTSDHGQLLGEHNFFGHRSALYEEIIKIPLLIKFPKGRPSPIDPERPIENRELFFLLLDEAGIELPNGCPRTLTDEQGVFYTMAESFLPSSTAHGIGLDENSKRFQEEFLGTRVAIIRHAPPYPKLILSTSGRDVLYLLDEDPKEQMNQIKDHQDLAQELRLVWTKWQQLLQQYSLEKEASQRMTREIIERLRSLGYIR